MSRLTRRQLVVVAAGLTIISTTTFLSRICGTPTLVFLDNDDCPRKPQQSRTALRSSIDDWNPHKFVASPSPSGNFRENLLADTYYTTTFCSGGLTNQLICFANLIYLGIISDRVPVIPPFTPVHHITYDAGLLDFGKVFDLDHLRQAIRHPVIEWSDLKSVPTHLSSPSNASLEEIGCWNLRGQDPGLVKPFWLHLHLDASFTDAPEETFSTSDHAYDHTDFWKVAALIYPKQSHFEGRTYDVRWPSDQAHHTLSPDTHLSCFDTTYYVSSGAAIFEWERSWSPAWRHVGQNLRFTQSINELAGQYLREAFGNLSPKDAIPPFIAVHVRHGDFTAYCGGGNCFAPLSTYASQVEEVKQEIWKKQHIEVSHVLLSSDEDSPEFWEEVRSLGWKYVDHAKAQTLEKLGQWYPPLIDTVVQSQASGFVGTQTSTLSLVSARRVEDWHGGSTRMVTHKPGN